MKLQSTVEALQTAYLTAVKEVSAHHPVALGIIETLKKCGIPNSAKFLADLKSAANTKGNSKSASGPSSRTNREGRELRRYLPNEPAKKKDQPAPFLPKINEPVQAQKKEQYQAKSQPQKSEEANAVEGDPVALPDFTMPSAKTLTEMSAGAMEKMYNAAELNQIAFSCGLVEDEIQGKNERQIASMIKRELMKNAKK